MYNARAVVACQAAMRRSPMGGRAQGAHASQLKRHAADDWLHRRGALQVLGCLRHVGLRSAALL